ncbi:alpha/beta fold hydrolase [Nocardia sp. BMG51109]|uniref:alpha/beta fold hydrolase n=1 Tax=Nocardia sp. BMG51109 TaxID=1056816 RepID=UPI0012EC8D34|nr:alpha/beta hydrolase [Nocardia sp. BMG51109]
MTQPDMRSIEVAGIPVGYFVQGEGPEIVLVHGAGGHPESSFTNLLEHLAQSRTVIVPGYSGSSFTPLPEEKLTFELLTEQILGVIRAAARGPVDIIGFSTGAVIAGVAAAKEPELVRRLISCGGFLHYRQPRQRMFVRTWLRLADADANAFADYTVMHALSDRYLDSISAAERFQIRIGLMPTTGLVALCHLVNDMDVTEYWQNITSPALVIAPKEDHLVPIRYARQLHDTIPGSEYVEIDSGHLVPVEKPAELLKIIDEFFAQPTP